MKIFSAWTTLTLALYVLQTSFLPLFSYNGVSVNLMLLLIISISLLKGHRWGVFIGFSAGLIQDLTVSAFFGCNIFIYMLLGLLCGKFSDHIFKEQFILPILSSIPMTAIYYFLMIAFLYMLDLKLNIQWSLQYTLIPMICYQFAFAYPIHKLVFEFNKRVNKYWSR